MACKRIFGGWTLSSAFLLTMMFFPGGVAQARHKDCRDRIHDQVLKVERAVRRHGERSRQAERARAKLREIRERCEERHDRR